jgi:FAD/FMN-containing dehydrogenase
MMTTQTRIDRAAVDELCAAVRGHVIERGDERYDRARTIYNTIHDRRPALIVQAVNAGDVLAAVRFAREQHLPLAVRGGSHGIAGFATNDDGLVLDLGRMRGIRVEPDKRSARAEPGVTWGDFNHAAHAFGQAVTGGIVATTGIAGLTLGGGMGHLARRCGLTCDNLLSADVVTADGRLLGCDEARHPDLFWALRGGGGNFGVVTSFEYRLHPVADILGGPTFYPLDGEIVQAYLQLLADSPDELNLVLVLALAPPAPFIPAPWHGRPVCGVMTCWSGPPQEDDEIRDRLERLGPAVGQFLERMPYPTINTLFDDLLPFGLRHYWKGCFNQTLSEKAINEHVCFAASLPSPQSATMIFPIDGACHRVASQDTAFSYREARFATGIGATWEDPANDAANIAWTRAYYDALRPTALAGGYVNFASDDDAAQIQANYQHNYRGLVAVKRSYDPENLFRLNQNIRPDDE